MSPTCLLPDVTKVQNTPGIENLPDSFQNLWTWLPDSFQNLWTCQPASLLPTWELLLAIFSNKWPLFFLHSFSLCGKSPSLACYMWLLPRLLQDTRERSQGAFIFPEERGVCLTQPVWKRFLTFSRTCGPLNGSSVLCGRLSRLLPTTGATILPTFFLYVGSVPRWTGICGLLPFA